MAEELSRIPEVPARLVFMGGQATEARARVIERSAAWRHSQVMKDMLILLLLPVAIIPPHVWGLIVLGIAFIRAFNHNREYRTLLSLRGPCPKCGIEQEFSDVGRMGNPHKVTCANCKWDSYVEVSRASSAT